jgi:hypothetical protein
MKRRRTHWPSAHVTALLAVALLTFATAKSVVMEVSAAMSPICSADSGGGPAGLGGGPEKPLHAACAYCAAAVHAPLISAPPSIASPCAVVWTPTSPAVGEGRGGSQPIKATARAPPDVPIAA